MAVSSYFSSDPETTGFDLSAGDKWIYPENYPKRDYQFNIVQTALYNNTLVCLPTGLGKTFIAAVAMYNFWRWYPTGKVVFMAPTKPLVAQQIQACHEIMGIPSEQTIELTGAVNQNKRKIAWTQKRVIFATPQTFQKDLQNNIVPCELIKCIVIDEAHKALGKHSYCEIVRLLSEKSKFFRVLALSATPGSKIDHVREVIQNLLISELELRDDASPDIVPYTNERQMERIIVGLGDELTAYKERYIRIIDPHLRVLIQNHILTGNTANMSKGRLFMLMKQYESRPQKPNNHGTIMKASNILLSMYHAYELLIKHGLRAFYNFYASHSDKYWFESELDLQLMLKDIKHYIGDFPVIRPLLDGTIPDVPENLIFGHNKFNKLRELLEHHFRMFSAKNESTRAIVFVEYRDIVNEIYVLLLQTRPLIRPQMFVGQAGQKQKEQLGALEDFRNNKVNVLISTSVGEEGLDVGEVDLIVCFDISSSTPIRLVQRMGRTGRKRNGRVVILLTEGKEVQTLNQAMSKKDSLNTKVLESSNISSSLYQSSPRMVPPNITPVCLEMFIKTQPKTPKAKRGRGKTAEKKPAGQKKPAAEKKPRKKKNAPVEEEEDIICLDNEPLQPQPSTSKADPHAKAHCSNQSSMMRFLTEKRPKPLTSICNYESDSGICDEFQVPVNPDNPYAMIRPHEVKLLTSDSHALEFLTLCAMKKSEELDDSGFFDIDDKWIPTQSPVDVIRDFVVPSLNTLDCLTNLGPYNGPIEEVKLDSDESFCEFPIMEVDNEDNFHMSNPCGRYSTIESKYVKDCDQMGSRNVDIIDAESDFFEDFDYLDKNMKKANSTNLAVEINASDFSDFELRSIGRANSTKLDTEINASDFLDDSSAVELKYPQSMHSDMKEPEAAIQPLLQESAKPSSQSLQGTMSRSPANIEVAFDNLLDECTESEASESQALIGDKNIFDDMLDDDSTTDDDLFAEDNNVTVLPQQDVTIANSPSRRLSAKRSASHSPCRESAVKKQRLSETDSTDTECEIMATPPKAKSRSFTNSIDVTLKPVPEVDDNDSDQDMFDDLDFETQFSFTEKQKKNHEECTVEQMGAVADDELDKTFFEEGEKVPPDKEDVLPKVKEKLFNVDENNAKISEETIAEKSIFVNKDNLPKEIVAFKETVEKERLSGECLESSKNASVLDPEDFSAIDWAEDDDFASESIQKMKTDFREKFGTNSKSNPCPAYSRSQESSSGWIRVDHSTENISIKPKKILSLKNSILSSFNKKPKSDPFDFEVKKLEPSHNNPKTMTIRGAPQPRPSLLSLKRIVPPEKDKDGFTLPQAQISKINQQVKPTLCNKENKLPQWVDTNSKIKKDVCMSPRFRKYCSENDLSMNRKKKKKPRARKRIANNFIDDEAEQSSDADTSEGSSGDEGADKAMESFVSYTQDMGDDDDDMRAHYLQTINKSPIRAGAFMFKNVRNHVPDHELYSQPLTLSQKDETYMHDSFCVGDDTQADENDDGDSSSDDSVLDKIEYVEDRKRSHKSKLMSKFEKLKAIRKQKQNKRNLSNNSDSSKST